MLIKHTDGEKINNKKTRIIIKIFFKKLPRKKKSE